VPGRVPRGVGGARLQVSSVSRMRVRPQPKGGTGGARAHRWRLGEAPAAERGKLVLERPRGRDDELRVRRNAVLFLYIPEHRCAVAPGSDGHRDAPVRRVRPT
jgi:hypothetical protein